jgi:dihydrofolate reductase
MRVIVINHLTLDGVMQAPGRADEDTRDGFVHGGWAASELESPDPAIASAMGRRMAASGGLLLGRRTYDDLLASWNERGGAFKDALNNAPKHVATTRATEPLEWPNSTRIGPDVASDVAAMKARPGGDLHVLGSGQLVRAMMHHQLVDEFMLIIHPIVLGSGRRLFADGSTPTTLQLAGAGPTASGAVITTYRTT